MGFSTAAGPLAISMTDDCDGVFWLQVIAWILLLRHLSELGLDKGCQDQPPVILAGCSQDDGAFRGFQGLVVRQLILG